MKKKLSILLALVVSFTLASCRQMSSSPKESVQLPDIFLYVGPSLTAQTNSFFASFPLLHTSAKFCKIAEAGSPCLAGSEASLTEVRASASRRIFGSSQGGLERSRYRLFSVGENAVSREVDLGEITDPIAAGLVLIKKENIQKEMEHLASDEMNGRLSGTKDHDRAADYIIKQLESLKIDAALSTGYKQEFKLSVGPLSGQKTYNLVSVINGTDPKLKDKYIVIGAHLDHAGTLDLGYTCSAGPNRDDKICNGADDNASGSISVLNVAKALSSVRHTLKRSVVFIWFSGEEEGLLGSKYYVNSDDIIPIEKIEYMINMDMVGYMKQNSNRLGALGGSTSPEAAAILKEIAKKYPERKLEVSAKAGGGSDHVPFMQKMPGVFFHTGVDINVNYHRTSDHPDLIDTDGMEYIGKVAFELLFRMLNRDPKPEGLNLVDSERRSYITEEEAKQTCHHLMENPYNQRKSLDFTDFEGE